jgi:acetyl/propionyl-CoA carboxylase alpha subunit
MNANHLILNLNNEKSFSITRKLISYSLIAITTTKIPLIGHAMEARIYAEDPENNFLPGSGIIKILKEP